MAKAPKTPVLTKAEIKSTTVSLKEVLKGINGEHGKFVSDHKAAVKAHADLVKAQAKDAAAAQKNVEAAAKKLEKATAAADKGRAKIEGQLAALKPVVTETAV